MNDPKGSIWRKWDLHLHTPASGGDYEDHSVTNARIIQKLTGENIAAVAITDHHIIDVDKIISLQSLANGNITIFPGIECRSELGGKESIHFTGVFPEDLNKTQLRAIWTKLSGPLAITEQDRKDKGEDKLYCDLKDSANLIHSLGGLVIVHAGTKNNTIENIKSNLAKFKDQVKTDLVTDYIDILEVSKTEDQKDYQEIVFPSIGFRLPMICCSDNHNMNKYENNRFTWIKADLTFKGLRQIIIEPEDRVFIGDEPEILKRVRGNKTKYIHSFAIKKEEESILDEIWFSKNPEIILNPGLISIIGNKGSGKSSIADTLGLLGNTQQSSHFSFLNPTKFRDRKDNKAKNFKAILKWESGDPSEKNLNDEIDDSAVETIKCIPQNYLEKICTEQIEGSLFNDELKKVIFSHVSDAEKLDYNKLDDLIEFKTKEKSSSIDIAKNEISTLNKEIAALEIKLHPDYKTQVNNKLQIKKQERASHEITKPKEKTKPGIDPAKQKEIDAITAEIYTKVENIQAFEKEIERIERERKSDYSKNVNSKKLLDKLDNFQKQYELFKSECKAIAEILALNVDDIVTLEIKRKDVEKINTESWASYTAKSDMLKEDNKDGPFFKKQQLQKEIDALRNKLDQPNKEYQAYLKEKAEWAIKAKAIDGDESTPETIKYYEKQIKEIDDIPEQLRILREQRLSKIKEIFDKLCQLRDEYSALYKPVKDFADSQKFSKERFSMGFRVSIICSGFPEQFFNFIAQNKKGSFYGADDGQKRLKDILDSSDFDNVSGLEKFLQQIEGNLNTDQRSEFKNNPSPRYINDQLRQGIQIQEFYDYIYSLDYLKPKYILRWAGKDLSQLSPGERGTVLLIFYLFISRDEIPLVIDQPEENLDNETVYVVLVPCIKEAKKRRQIIIVTHNPNLAVVCDADQIIHCEMKKEEKNKITYISGAIENPKINKALIDILEGTQPAFDNRDQKYYAERLNYARPDN
jgi:ABC-type lipoprotein export system ATPase subunit